MAFTLNTRQTTLPNKRASKKGEMDNDTFVGAVRAAVLDAEDYIDGHIAPLRAIATRFYRGEPFGNEEHGRSQIVMTELRDAVHGIMPSLLRIFVSGENIVEFIPQNAASIELADQQTEYVNHVFMQDNPGFLILYSAIKDALVRKTGVIKWRWSEDTTVTETAFTGLPAEQVAILQESPHTEIVELVQGEPMVIPVDDPNAVPGQEQTAPPQTQAVPTYDVRIRRTFPRNRCVIECLPPEEYLINRDARDANSEYGYKFQAHRQHKTVSDIVAMGYDKQEVLDNCGSVGDTFSFNYEAQERNPAIMAFMGANDTPDDSMREVLFIEAYMRIDKDGDGIAELRKIHMIGEACHVLSDEIVDEAPFAVFCPDPEPHMVIGQSIADQTMDIQLIKSNMVRALLDSLAGSIHPRTVVVEGQVNLDDAMNTEQGAIIRAKQIAAVQELVKPFVGQGALPVIAYIDQVKSKRTGLTDASQGLDPQVLQSATHAAVTATVSGAQERIELYARIFAETAAKRLFKGLAKCLKENQDQPRVMKLRGEFVEMNPRTWDGDLDVRPNVALGKGTDTDKMNFLSLVLQKQETIMQVLGPVNPLAGIDKYRATLAQLMTFGGFKDATRYFGVITPQYMQQLQQSSGNKPDPQMLIVQIEAQKVKNAHDLKVAEFQQKQLEGFQKDQLARETLRMETLTKLLEIQAKHGQDPNMAMIDRLLTHEADMATVQSNHMTAIHQNLTGLASDMHGQAAQGHVDHTNNEMKDATARAGLAAPTQNPGAAAV